MISSRPLQIVAAVLLSALPLAAQSTPEKAPVKIGWSDGKTTIEAAHAAVNISQRLQVRFTGEDPEGGDTKGSFRIRRARTKIDGWAYSKKLTYELQMDWADNTNHLQDANINYASSDGFQVTVGQFKVPFGRQELTSSTRQQFVDRSAVSEAFTHGRDIGVQLWGLTLGKRLDWRVGAFNGNGRTVSANDNTKLQYVGRVTWQPFGDVKYSESDFDSKGKPLFAIAANYENNDRTGATAGNDVARETLGADVSLKYRGFSIVTEYFTRDNDPEIGASSSAAGWYVQSGYFIVPSRFELAARYGTYDPNDLVRSNDRTETGLAFNWFLQKHNLKLQTDVRRIKDQGTGLTNREARMQLQVIF